MRTVIGRPGVGFKRGRDIPLVQYGRSKMVMETLNDVANRTTRCR